VELYLHSPYTPSWRGAQLKLRNIVTKIQETHRTGSQAETRIVEQDCNTNVGEKLAANGYLWYEAGSDDICNVSRGTTRTIPGTGRPCGPMLRHKVSVPW